MRSVAWLGYDVAFCLFVLAWYAAIRFGHDSRDGQDWERHPPV